MFHAHQDDVVEQQEVAQVRDLEDRPAQGAVTTLPSGGRGSQTGFSFP